MRQWFARFLIVLSMTLGGAFTASAQTPVAGNSASAPTQQDIDSLTATLNDPAARQKLVQQLQLLTQVQKPTQPAAAPVEVLGAGFYAFVSSHLDSVTDEIRQLDVTFADFPKLVHIVQHRLNDPATSGEWADIGAALLFVIASGVATYGLARLLTQRLVKGIESKPIAGFWPRLGFALLRLGVLLLPVIVFAGTGYAVIHYVNEAPMEKEIAVSLINLTTILMGLVALGQFVLSPGHPQLRIMPSVGENGARFLYSSGRRLAALVIYTYFVLATVEALGLPHAADRALLKLAALILAALLIFIIVQNRQPVTAWLRKDQSRHLLKLKNLNALSGARYFFAGIWYIVAIAFVLVTFVTWALNLEGGATYILHSTLGTIGAVIAGRIAVVLVDQLTDRGLTFSIGLRERLPGLELRVNRYVPRIRSLLHWLIAGLVILTLFYAWGLDSFSWITMRNVYVARALSIAFVVITATLAWEMIAAGIERMLVGGMNAGIMIERSARVRTLLPLLRNFFFIFILVIAGMVILSELGIDTRPLLAGAGVIGVAVGFGSQTLVKDVITGMFILFENTIAVGDVVDLGNKHSGTVEGLTIRTLRVRDGNGGIHTVPFSEVSSIVNSSRDFSCYVFDLTLNYRADTDRVVQIMKDIVEELRAEPDYADVITGPLEVWGVDGLLVNGVNLKAALRTRANRQWGPGREFNRRLKMRLQAAGIPPAMPMQETYDAGLIKPLPGVA